MVPIVEKGHVVARPQRFQELQQRSRALRELEAQDALVLHRCGRLAADHVAHMALGKGVPCHVGDLVTVCSQVGNDLLQFGHAAVQTQRSEYLRPFRVAHAVVELRHHAVAQLLAQLQEGSLPLGDDHGYDALALFAHLATLGNEAQCVEIHIRAGKDGCHARTPQPVFDGVLFHPGQRKSAGRLGNGPRIVKNVLERCADLIVAACDDLIDVPAQYAEGLHADAPHGHAVGEQGDPLQIHGLPGIPCRLEAGRTLGLHGNDLHLRQYLLDIHSHAGGQAAATHLDEDMGQAAVLLQKLPRDGALPGDHVGIVIGRDEREPLLARKAHGFGIGFVKAAAEEHHVAAKAAHGVHLDIGRRPGHDDGRFHPQPASRKGASLRMIAGRGGDDAALPGFFRKLGDLIVCAPQLEGVHGLQVLALEEDAAAYALGKFFHVFKGSDARHVVHGRKQYLAQVLCSAGLLFGHDGASVLRL